MQKQNLFTKVFFFILLSLIIKNTNAQTGLNFQGVARNANNVILASQPISLRLSILQGSATGNAEYTEVRKVNTNAQGLFTAVIGDTGAISTLGNYATINWKSNPKFLKIEMDAAAGNNFIIMGTTQFQSVAYAQFANSVDAENIAGIVPVARGGTGTNSLAALKTALAIDKATVGLSNADNTTDLLKPISTATQAALSLKLNAADTSKYSKQKYLDSALLTKLNTNTIIDAGTLTGTTLKSSVTNSSLTTVGTIETGIWSATTIDIEHGGTNSTAIPTAGGIGFGTGTAHAYTSAGTAGQILSSNGTSDPIWVTPNTISVPYTGATSAVDLGAFDLKVNSLSIGLGAGNVPTNTAFGLNALNSNTTGGFNVAVGTLALSSNTSGNGNVAVGSTALIKNTTGGFNTATGVSALKNNEIGNSNTAFGNSALVSNVSGNNNVANGLFALRNNVTGSSNVAIGSNTLVTNISGSRNTAIGQDADLASDGLTNATAIGSGAIVNADNTIQLGNSSISSVVTSGTMSATAYTGTWSGEIIDIAHGGTGTNTVNLVDLSTDQNISGAKTFLSDANINGLTIGKGAGNIPTNTVTGSDALRSNTNGVQNIAFGYTALKSNSIGNDNVAVGAFSLSTNTSGLSNIAIGTSTMFGNQTGNSNIAVGGGALIHNDNGNDNVANGVLALQDNVTGSSNVALGNYALASNSSGNGNTVIGYNSFYHNTTGSNNTAIGANANVGAANLTNATAIGAGAIVSAHNTIQLGNTNVSSVITSGTISATGFVSATGYGTATGTSTQFLKADGSVDGATYVNKDNSTIGIGKDAGKNNQGVMAIAMGDYTGYSNQSPNAIAIGTNAGQNSQGVSSIGIGMYAGVTNQGHNSIGIGTSAGYNGQGINAIGVGENAGKTNQGMAAIGIGHEAGKDNQGLNSIAIGVSAGTLSQTTNAIAIGSYAGNSEQGLNAIALGLSAGDTEQGINSIAIGNEAGAVTQGPSSIAIGVGAGNDLQGANSIAIGEGAGNSGQAANSIILNATGSALNASNTGFFVAPIQPAITSMPLYYNTITNEITYGTAIDASTLSGTTLATNIVTSSLTGVGTITSGTWSGTTIAVTNGGTGLTSPGPTGNVLTSNGTDWVSAPISSSVDLTTAQTVGGSKSFTSNLRVGTETPTSSAVLEVSSTTQGFLPPRMTLAQRDAIVSPATGLIIFCTDCTPKGDPEFYNGTRWTSMKSAAPLASTIIGDQVWTSTNLNVGKYRNGDVIPQVTGTIWASLTTGAWCWYNDDSATYAATYGKLYNWYAVNDPRGLAPLGWHIPTDEEWTILTDYLGGASVAGGAMKQTGTTLWTTPNTGATNTSGFSGLPGGHRISSNTFNELNGFGHWWSSSNNASSHAWIRYLWYNSAEAYRNSAVKYSALSVRCVKD